MLGLGRCLAEKSEDTMVLAPGSPVIFHDCSIMFHSTTSATLKVMRLSAHPNVPGKVAETI
jgi:hypothetical protein